MNACCSNLEEDNKQLQRDLAACAETLAATEASLDEEMRQRSEFGQRMDAAESAINQIETMLQAARLPEYAGEIRLSIDAIKEHNAKIDAIVNVLKGVGD